MVYIGKCDSSLADLLSKLFSLEKNTNEKIMSLDFVIRKQILDSRGVQRNFKDVFDFFTIVHIIN